MNRYKHDSFIPRMKRLTHDSCEKKPTRKTPARYSVELRHDALKRKSRVYCLCYLGKKGFVKSVMHDG
ncbi:MAG: hypothetical protein RLY31_3019 [Bacteroidota bacterium]|jgi:hypothetical protein